MPLLIYTAVMFQAQNR